VLLSILLFAVLAITTYFAFMDKNLVMSPLAEQIGTVNATGKELYTTFSFPFEAVSFILIAAIVGSIILAKKKFD
jgi:NADH-quinone oxidoreductase subunit J